MSKVNAGFHGSVTSAQRSNTRPEGAAKKPSTVVQTFKKSKWVKIIAVGVGVVLVLSVVIGVWYATKPVDGSFSSWSDFGPCSKSCGGGTKKRTRECNQPAPRNGGNACSGPSSEIGFCANSICPGSSGISMTQQIVQDILLNYHSKLNQSKQSSGRFQKAVFSMQREVANEQAFDYLEAQSSRSKRDLDSIVSSLDIYEKKRTLGECLDDMKKTVKIAVNRTGKDFARTIFAKSLYVFIKKEIKDGTPISKISTAADGYLESIKKDIGEQNFDELILVSGGATLMFAIDTTGSMSAEINAAKEIAISIINRKRRFPVDYILSPFNDPGTGPVIYRTEREREDFVTGIRRLSARGGGDCPELAFAGMLNAFKEEPQLGSPMFVFTDASAKDGSRANINELKRHAEHFSATINFFMKNSCGGGIPADFNEVASYTSGQIFPLKTDSEIEKFKDYVDDSLKDSVIITEGKDGSDIYITLDGQITTLLISLEVIQAGQAQYVKLVDPVGRYLAPVLTTTYTCIFKTVDPFPGTWHLKYPKGIDIKSYVAKSAGNNTIDFHPYFLHSENEDGSGPVISVPQPVRGRNTTAMLQVSGSKLLDLKSLLMDVISESGRLLQNDIEVLQSDGGSGILKGNLVTPNGKFKVKLKGKTSDGQNFTRLSQLNFIASNIVMLTIRAGNDFTATISNKTAPIKVYFFSNVERSYYQLTVSSSRGNVKVSPSYFELMKGANATISMTHSLPSNAAMLVGEIVKITVNAKSTRSLESKEHQIQMMYVP